MGRERVIGFHRDLPPFKARRMDWRRFPDLVRRRSLKAPAVQPLPPLLEATTSGGGEKEGKSAAWQVNPDLFRTRISPDRIP
jgi:hypothetical protein